MALCSLIVSYCLSKAQIMACIKTVRATVVLREPSETASPCSRKRSDMMRSARTITRLAPAIMFKRMLPRFNNRNRFESRSCCIHHVILLVSSQQALQRLQSSLRCLVNFSGWDLHNKQRKTQTHQGPTMSSAFTEPSGKDKAGHRQTQTRRILKNLGIVLFHTKTYTSYTKK